MTGIHRKTAKFLFLSLVVVAMASDTAVSQQELPASQAEIQSWISGLQSDQIAIREWATQMLLKGGPQVIDPLAKSIAGFDLESTIRGLEVLRSLALDELATAALAEEAIRRLAENRVAASSGRAEEVLRSVEVMRAQRAENILSRLGVGFSVTVINTGAYSYGAPMVRTISFGDRWSGTVEDLVFLNWLKDARGISIEASGDQINDAWLRQIARVRNVVGLKLGRSAITDQGMQALEAMPQLRDIRIYNCDVSDAWLKVVDSEKSNLKSLSVFGSRMTREAVEHLEKKNPDLITRHGAGGFLGIQGDQNPRGAGCLVKEVTPNAAASKADIRKDDIILEYDGHVVSDFMPPQRRLQRLAPVIPIESTPERDEDDKSRRMSLSELIAKNRRGERVKVKILRGKRELTKEVVLGEWR